MTEEELQKIKEHIEIYARMEPCAVKITQILWKAVEELEATKKLQEKIPQLEHKIASIRGAHSVDCKKLKARTEQVERLKKQVRAMSKALALNLPEADEKIIEAKEIIKALLNVFVYDIAEEDLDVGHIDVREKAKKFLKEE